MRDSDDTKLRELAYRLAQMAPDAPPFPEEPMVQLRPSPTTRPTPPRRRSPLALVGVAALVVLLVVGGPLLLDRLTSDETPGPATTLPPTTATAPPTTQPTSTSVEPQPAVPTNVTLYFVDEEGHLVPIGRVVDASPSTHDQLAAALGALFSGTTSDDEAVVKGIGTSIPAGVTLAGIDTDPSGGTGSAVVVVSDDFRAADWAAVGQLVYTATQFADIATVALSFGNGAPAVIADGSVLDTPLARSDFFGNPDRPDLLAPVFVSTPPVNGVVGSPFTITGVANVFEAQLGYELVTVDGTVLAGGSATASCGTGCWGDFSIDVAYEVPQVEVGYVVVYTTSPQDGSRIDDVRHLVTIEANPGEPQAATPYTVLADVPGGPPLDGLTVVTSPLIIYGTTGQGTELRVNGQIVPVTDGSWETTLDLAPGANEILIEDVEFNATYTVTYVPDGTVEFGYIDSFLEDGVVIDRAEWLTGAAASQAAFEDGVIGSVDEGVPNDYYIRNPEVDLQDYPVGADLAVFLATPAQGGVSVVPVGLQEWFGLFAPDSTPWDPAAGDQPPEPAAPHFGYFGAGTVYAPYWFTLDASGNLLQLVQQYVP